MASFASTAIPVGPYLFWNKLGGTVTPSSYESTAPPIGPYLFWNRLGDTVPVIVPQPPGVFGGGGTGGGAGGEIEPWPTKRTEPTYDEEVFDMAMIAALIIRKFH